ncbi:MAG TPA: hypothetical protein VKZ81_18775 [Pseudonocardia sp.]|jgi:hypothetical protein|uniref:hypothetical protein n=1 Tax=Pseudonocardia sp. TaxID=60912 RepID=UPI002B4AED69|nr:hypothetical protein [Pseudonocardia sp.]HLU57504.1 hypothetical protein [Pseudonocardia sp.]
MGGRRVVELRVHGVSGTSPEELLGDPHPRPAPPGGDRGRRGRRPLTGFYRPAAGTSLEGYAWGGLTSGRGLRALWLLLLPFALANVAPRMRPPGGARSRPAVWALLTLSRLLALALTATFVVAAAGVGVDLLAWQCGGEPGRCRAFVDAVVPPSWPPGDRLLVGLVLPAGMLALVHVLSRATARRYEAVARPSAPGPGSERGAADDLDPGLTHPWLWRGERMVRRTRGIHLQVGALAVVVLVAGSLADPGYRDLVRAIGLATIAAGALLLALPPVVGRRDRSALRGPVPTLWLPTAVACLMVVWPLATDPAAVRPDLGGALRSYDAMITWLFAVQAALIVLIAVAVFVLRRDTRTDLREGQAFHGFGTVLAASVAFQLGAAFSAGVYLAAAGWLSEGDVLPDLVGAPRGQGLLLPPSLQVTAVAFVAGAALVGVAGLTVLPRLLAGWRSERIGELLATYPERCAGRDPARDEEIRKVFWRARLVDLAPAVLLPLLTALTIGALLVTGLLTAALWSDGARAVVAAIGELDGVSAVGAAGIVILLLVATALAVAALSVERTRRVVGIVWDIAAFWPRAVHPLAPPCYAERTVPELIDRIRYHVGSGERPEPDDYPRGALVLSAHSQGSVIAAATVLQLGDEPDPATTDGLALLTHGSVLRRFYSRYFPAYFGRHVLAELAGRMPRWRNLWRLSDPLGGPVLADLDEALHADLRVDRRLVDPPYHAPPGSRPAGHSRYPDDPAYGRQLEGLAAALTCAPASVCRECP